MADVMLASELEMADPAGLWLSEKLDGVRAVWTGAQFISRTGKVLAAPEWMLAGMPADVVLDGELWMGRGRFRETAAELRRTGAGDLFAPRWAGMRFMVFDVVAAGSFEDRVQLIPRLPDQAEVVRHDRCRSLEHFERYAATVVAKGGEGVVLRDGAAQYVAGRSEKMFKWKPVQTAEAVVIGWEPGTGRNLGRAGALVCEMGGAKFKISAGLTKNDRKAPPVGERLTVEFSEFTRRGVPRDARVVTVRDYE